jgi:hypothetical protein
MNYDFVKLKLDNGDEVFINITKIALCTVKEKIIEITLVNDKEYILNKEICKELLEELNFRSTNNE